MCLARSLLGGHGLPVRASDERLRPGSGVRRRELEPLRDPALDELTVRPQPPHPRADRGLEDELTVELGLRWPIDARADRVLHRGPERLTVVLERVRPPDLAPSVGLLPLERLELDGTVQQPQALVDLVPAHRKLGGTP